MSYVTPTNELGHTNQWANPHQPMSYAAPSYAKPTKWATQYQAMSYATPTNELRDPNQWASSHQQMS